MIDLTKEDEEELDRFRKYLRLISEAVAAGVPRAEAMQAIYPDVYDTLGETCDAKRSKRQ